MLNLHENCIEQEQQQLQQAIVKVKAKTDNMTYVSSFNYFYDSSDSSCILSHTLSRFRTMDIIKLQTIYFMSLYLGVIFRLEILIYRKWQQIQISIKSLKHHQVFVVGKYKLPISSIENFSSIKKKDTNIAYVVTCLILQLSLQQVNEYI